jgi:hypothetical protein
MRSAYKIDNTALLSLDASPGLIIELPVKTTNPQKEKLPL